jgi:DNA processing protein
LILSSKPCRKIKSIACENNGEWVAYSPFPFPFLSPPIPRAKSFLTKGNLVRNTYEDIRYWLAAVRLHDIGPIRINRWLNYFNEIKNLFNASAAELQAAGLTEKEIHSVKNPDWKGVEHDLAWQEKENCHILIANDLAYPLLLKEIPDPPIVLFLKGTPATLSHLQLAIVGTRNPTITGKETAYHFAHCLAASGLTITSGLALGIDAASHQGALAANAQTIAVTGAGLNYIYPASHKKLADKITGHGVLVSEFPPDFKPVAKNFPRRNRIISGLSLGVLVVEAAVRSGSLITARFAAEQGREVFAIPGSIHNPLAHGCHKIIQQGAKLIEKAEDILEELGALRLAAIPPAEPSKLPPLDQKLRHLLAQIGDETTSLDRLIIRSGLTVAEVSSMLLALELRGSVQAVSGGYALTALAKA